LLPVLLNFLFHARKSATDAYPFHHTSLKMPARRAPTPINADTSNENELITEKIEGQIEVEEDDEVSPSFVAR
jgi:hypothetical protein